MAFSFGSSHLPSRIPTEEPPEVFDYGDRGNVDPERLLQCPFDKSHHIRACRFPYHLLKCRKNHPKLASELRTCPFNASHLVPQQELAHHTQICQDRTCVVAEPADEGVNIQRAWQLPISTCVNPDTSEDWDQEAEDFAVPFVWGQQLNQRAEPKPASNASFRVPNTLPWSS